MTRNQHSRWHGDYVTLLERLQPQRQADPAERRADPRIAVDGRLTVEHEGRQYPVLDISAGGIAFAAEAATPPGALTLSLNHAFQMDVEVLPNGQPATGAPAQPARRVRGRFVDAEQGLLYMSLAMLLLDAAMNTPVL